MERPNKRPIRQASPHHAASWIPTRASNIARRRHIMPHHGYRLGATPKVSYPARDHHHIKHRNLRTGTPQVELKEIVDGEIAKESGQQVWDNFLRREAGFHFVTQSPRRVAVAKWPAC
jgi:hypothetical protein